MSVCVHCCKVSCGIISGKVYVFDEESSLSYTVREFLTIFFSFFIFSAFGSNAYPFFFQNNR